MSRKANPDRVQVEANKDEARDEAISVTEDVPAPTPPADLTPPAPTPQQPSEAEQPQHGGSFLRQQDGTLTLVERTLQLGETAERQEA